MVFLFLIEIANAGAIVDACGAFDGASDVQNLVAQRRFSGQPVAAEHNVADILDLDLRHASFPFM
jgi:hypothetical protein